MPNGSDDDVGARTHTWRQSQRHRDGGVPPQIIEITRAGASVAR